MNKDEPLAKRRRFKLVKVGAAFAIVLLLMMVGYQGRQRARLQGRLNLITRLCEQIQQKLDDEQRTAAPFATDARGTRMDTDQSPSAKQQIEALVSTLKIRLGQFDSAYRPAELSKVESLDLRLSNATLANNERRFAEALTMITGEDEKERPANAEVEIMRLARVLQIRGEAYYGLREWQNALDRFRQLLNLQPGRLATKARIADCQYALGELSEALTTYDDLAKRHNDRGNMLIFQGKLAAAIGHYEKANEIQTGLVGQGRSELANDLAMSHRNLGAAFLIQRKPDAAIGHYQLAIDIETRLIEKDGRNELASELAMSRNNLGDAFLVQGKPGSAIEQYGKAIETRTRLNEQGGQSDFSDELAMIHNNLGNAFLAQGRAEAAIGHYDKAIEMLSGHVEPGGRSEPANELARSYNNRGVARRAQKKLAAAMEDFGKAIEILSRLTEPGGRSELESRPAKSINDRNIVRSAEVRLDVAVEYSEKAIDFLTRSRLKQQVEPGQPAVSLAMALKNRGYAQLSQGRPDLAIGDFKRAVETDAKLVGLEGQDDAVVQLAKSLIPLAWIYATNPDSSLRDGGKAKELALQACKLTHWKAFIPVETLAAAYAETGDFADAVKWQEKALELAPPKQKIEAGSRLDLFKSAKPYRTSLPATG